MLWWQVVIFVVAPILIMMTLLNVDVLSWIKNLFQKLQNNANHEKHNKNFLNKKWIIIFLCLATMGLVLSDYKLNGYAFNEKSLLENTSIWNILTAIGTIGAAWAAVYAAQKSELNAEKTNQIMSMQSDQARKERTLNYFQSDKSQEINTITSNLYKEKDSLAAYLFSAQFDSIKFYTNLMVHITILEKLIDYVPALQNLDIKNLYQHNLSDIFERIIDVNNYINNKINSAMEEQAKNGFINPLMINMSISFNSSLFYVINSVKNIEILEKYDVYLAAKQTISVHIQFEIDSFQQVLINLYSNIELAEYYKRDGDKRTYSKAIINIEDDWIVNVVPVITNLKDRIEKLKKYLNEVLSIFNNLKKIMRQREIEAASLFHHNFDSELYFTFNKYYLNIEELFVDCYKKIASEENISCTNYIKLLSTINDIACQSANNNQAS